MTTPIRELRGKTSGTFGGNRRPSRVDLTPIDPALLALFNRGTDNAIRYNRGRPEREDNRRWAANSRAREASK